MPLAGVPRRSTAFNAKDGQLAWEFATRQRVDSAPVIAGDRVYAAAGDGRLYALDLATGKEIWQLETGGGFTGSPAVSAQRLVIASDDGVVYCFGRSQSNANDNAVRSWVMAGTAQGAVGSDCAIRRQPHGPFE